jgi:Fe-S cluster assembly protein SufD
LAGGKVQLEELSQSQKFFLRLKEQVILRFSNDPLKGFRDRAWDHFLELGLPEKKQEAFQYIPLRQLYQQNFVNAVLADRKYDISEFPIHPECRGSHLVFIDGFYCSELSNFSALPKQVVVLGLEQATHTYRAFLQNRWAKTLKEETDPFAALNAAMHARGAFVYVPPNIELDVPVQCLHIITSDAAGTLVLPRLQLFLGSCSKVQWISTTHSHAKAPVMVSAVMDVALEDGANFSHTNSLQNEPDAWYFDAFRATLKRNSRLQSIAITSGSKSVRQDYRVALLGENSEADLRGIWMLAGNKQAHAHVVMDHQAPHCQSMQLFKGVANDSSQSSFEGKIIVRPIAQKTKAYQLNNNMILGDRAIANSKPNLEIFADDVKASHGATVAKLDPSQLFYLKTRGLSDEAAKTLLILGFCREVIDQISCDSLREEMLSSARNYLSKDL